MKYNELFSLLVQSCIQCGQTWAFATNLGVFRVAWSAKIWPGRSRPGMQSWAFFNFCQNCQKIGVKWHFSCKIDKKFFSNFSTWEKMPGRKSKFPGRFLVIWKSWSVNWSFLGISYLVAKLVVLGKFLVVFDISNLATLISAFFQNISWETESNVNKQTKTKNRNKTEQKLE